MNVEIPDQDRMHLYPEFRIKLHDLLADMDAQGVTMMMFEGYRSQERQTWLYDEGRPGTPEYHPGEIVTYMEEPLMHGVGLAADCYPANKQGGPIWSFTPVELHAYHLGMIKFGLRPTNMRGDFGHVELNTSIDGTIHVAAAKWVADGFK